ncbi:MAG: AAA family ATPase [Chloroflexi bacterium]|nr:MAG: AAA family ATPase [Chloroflexota bacterium]
MPKLVADLHIHSHYSRATSRDLDFEHLNLWAQLKGVHVVGTGDIAHPGWLAEMRQKLEPAEEGLFRLKEEYTQALADQAPPACRGPVRFMLAGEVSNIYKRDGQVRKVHHILFVPSLAAVERLQAALEKIGNIRADGRPILGLDSRDLLEIVLETDPQGYLIPAHIWTPWFAVLGSKSGFDSIEACFGDLTSHIFALETGLSSDPPMNWRVSSLDRYTLVSNSDAHSPPKLAREATVFHTEPSYSAIFAALKSGDPNAFGGTLEFFPEEGKYHCDGHRNCNVRWEPEETTAHQGRCPVCGKEVTVGVLNRVATLADRPPGGRPARTHPYANLIPLPEILGEVLGVGAGARKVQQAYQTLLGKLGPELSILQDAPLPDLVRVGGELLAEGIRRMRSGEVSIAAGYDGEYGVIKLFEQQERSVSTAQLDLFGARPQRPASSRRAEANREEQGDAARPSPWAQTDLFALKQPVAESDNKSYSLPQEPTPNRIRENPPHPRSIPFTPSALLAGLNTEQQAAVRCIDSPLLIVAGPGTGKTRTLTHRIAYLMTEHGVAPEMILAITFTNKAAEEMVQRLTTLLGSALADRLTVQTFHAFAAGLLRAEGAAIELAPDFAIASEDDRLALLRRLYPDWNQKELGQALEAISTAKNDLRTPETVTGPATPESETLLAAVYRAYDAELRRNRLVDFDDLIYLTVRLLEGDAALLQRVQERYRWISVDEYQDINLAQYRLLRLLTKTSRAPANLCAIGDPDQAIYGFRGADRRYFLRFEEDYPGAQVLRLRQNYRSTQLILDAATQVIAGNASAERLRIWSDFLDQTKLEIYPAPTDKAEAEYVVHQIEQMVGGTSLFSLDSGRVGASAEGVRSFGDFAVLYRTGAQSRPLCEAFERSGIPYQTVGQTPLVKYAEIREILAFLHLAHNPKTELYREQLLADLPKRVIPAVTAFLAELHTLCATAPVTELIDRIQQFLSTVVRRTPDEQAQERIARLRRQAIPYASRVVEFLELLALQKEADLYDPRADRVTLMTLHAAKGLEFPVVFITGCEEGLLPYERPGEEPDVEEERRLFFVGMTRARRKLVLTHARTRFLFGQRLQNEPSRFLADIEHTLKEIKEMARRPAEREKPELQQLSLF